jgi:hypothetical protein
MAQNPINLLKIYNIDQFDWKPNERTLSAFIHNLIPQPDPKIPKKFIIRGNSYLVTFEWVCYRISRDAEIYVPTHLTEISTVFGNNLEHLKDIQVQLHHL